MIHVLLAGLIMISGSQTTTTSAARGHTGANGGGAVFHVSVQTQHASTLPPVTPLRRLVPPNSYEMQQLQQAKLADRLQYCTRSFKYFAYRQTGCREMELGLPGVLFF